MDRVKALALAIGCVGLVGCGTVGHRERAASPYDSLPAVTSMVQAHHFGRQLVGYYGQGFERANNRRRWFNIGIWAATTYTTGAAGLGAHADNIFAGALTGVALGSLEPLANEGGPEAWVHALGKTACLSRAAMTGMDAKTIQAIALIEQRMADDVATDPERAAYAVYQGVYRSVGNGYDTVYAEFLTRRTGRAISAQSIGDFVSQAQTAAAGAVQTAGPPSVTPPSPGEVAAAATADALNNIETRADAIDGTGSLFASLSSVRDPLLVDPAGRGITLRDALSDPSASVSIAESDKTALVDQAPAEAEETRGRALDALIAEIRRSAQAVRAARIQAESDLAGADPAATPASVTARDAAVWLEAMNTSAARQIELCLKTE